VELVTDHAALARRRGHQAQRRAQREERTFEVDPVHGAPAVEALADDGRAISDPGVDHGMMQRPGFGLYTVPQRLVSNAADMANRPAGKRQRRKPRFVYVDQHQPFDALLVEPVRAGLANS